MADSQGVPVFLRHYIEAEPQFLGRFDVRDLEDLVESVRAHGCYYGDDTTVAATTQYLCYQMLPSKKFATGFEIVLGLTDEDVSG